MRNEFERIKNRQLMNFLDMKRLGVLLVFFVLTKLPNYIKYLATGRVVVYCSISPPKTHPLDFFSMTLLFFLLSWVFSFLARFDLNLVCGYISVC